MGHIKSGSLGSRVLLVYLLSLSISSGLPYPKTKALKPDPARSH